MAASRVSAVTASVSWLALAMIDNTCGGRSPFPVHAVDVGEHGSPEVIGPLPLLGSVVAHVLGNGDVAGDLVALVGLSEGGDGLELVGDVSSTIRMTSGRRSGCGLPHETRTSSFSRTGVRPAKRSLAVPSSFLPLQRSTSSALQSGTLLRNGHRYHTPKLRL